MNILKDLRKKRKCHQKFSFNNVETQYKQDKSFAIGR